jgi:hypothetical protein
MNYIYTDTNGQKYRINDEDLRTLVAQGLVTPGTMIETDTGYKDVAGNIPGLFNVVPLSKGKSFTEGVRPYFEKVCEWSKETYQKAKPHVFAVVENQNIKNENDGKSGKIYIAICIGLLVVWWWLGFFWMLFTIASIITWYHFPRMTAPQRWQSTTCVGLLAIWWLFGFFWTLYAAASMIVLYYFPNMTVKRKWQSTAGLSAVLLLLIGTGVGGGKSKITPQTSKSDNAWKEQIAKVKAKEVEAKAARANEYRKLADERFTEDGKNAIPEYLMRAIGEWRTSKMIGDKEFVLENLEYLLSKGVDVNGKSPKYGMTALHGMAYYIKYHYSGKYIDGYEDFIDEIEKYLITKGADVNARDRNGRTSRELEKLGKEANEKIIEAAAAERRIKEGLKNYSQAEMDRFIEQIRMGGGRVETQMDRIERNLQRISENTGRR